MSKLSHFQRSSSTQVLPQPINIPIPDFDDIPGENENLELKINRIDSDYKFSPRSDEIPLILPCFNNGGSVIPRIQLEIMVNILNGLYKNKYKKLFIIDCRYPYEYDGGHLPKSININSPAKLHEIFFSHPIEGALIIFHCEFSKNRGPQMAEFFRGIDRELNFDRYPALYYPNVYILNGGYRGFYQSFPQLCEGSYTPMLDRRNRINGNLKNDAKNYRREIRKHFVEKRHSLCLTSPGLLFEDCSTTPIHKSILEDALSPCRKGPLRTRGPVCNFN